MSTTKSSAFFLFRFVIPFRTTDQYQRLFCWYKKQNRKPEDNHFTYAVLSCPSLKKWIDDEKRERINGKKIYSYKKAEMIGIGKHKIILRSSWFE